MKAFAENPLLAHAMRMRYWRDPRPVAVLLRIAGVSAYGGVMLVMLMGLFFAASGGDAEAALRIVAWAGLLMVLVFVPIFLAPQFAGERERRTWDDLVVTRLTAAELVEGKILGGLYWAGLLLLSWLPFLALAAVLPAWMGMDSQETLDAGTVAAVFVSALAVAGTAWALAWVALLRSLLCTRIFRVLVPLWSVAAGALVVSAFVVLVLSELGGPNVFVWGFTALNPFMVVEGCALSLLSGEFGFGRFAIDSAWPIVAVVLMFVLVYGGIGEICRRRLMARMWQYDRRMRERG